MKALVYLLKLLYSSYILRKSFKVFLCIEDLSKLLHRKKIFKAFLWIENVLKLYYRYNNFKSFLYTLITFQMEDLSQFISYTKDSLKFFHIGDFYTWKTDQSFSQMEDISKPFCFQIFSLRQIPFKAVVYIEYLSKLFCRQNTFQSS